MPDHPEWGPPLSDYCDTFEQRIDASFAHYAKQRDYIVARGTKWVPLSGLEMGLAVNEHMYKMGFQSQGHLYTTLMLSLREYAKIHNGNIFDYYYGFLCFRHLVHMVCRTTLENSDKAGTFLDQTPPSMPWMKASENLSEAALELLYRAVTIKDTDTLFQLLGFTPVHGPIVFFRGACEGGMTEDDVRFLIDVLWKSRKSIMMLYSKGLLHGFPVLFFVFHQMTHLNDEIPTFERPWTKLQDLILRCYLSTSKDSDRQYLRQVSQWIHDLFSVPGWTSLFDYTPADDEDAREVVQAYSTLLTPPIPLSLAPIMLLDMAITLFRWLYYMLTNPKPKRPTLIQLLPSVAKAAFERLWLELDREWDGPMPDRRRPFTRMYATDLFWHLSAYFIECGDPQSREALVRVFIDVEMYSLLGRLLLFVSRETEQKPSTWEDLIESSDNLSKAFGPPAQMSEDESYVAMSEWYKVSDQITYFRDLYPNSQTPELLVNDARIVWWDFRCLAIRKSAFDCTCAYQRCAAPWIKAPLSTCSFECGRCKKVRYCSKRCQQMHWAPTAGEAHARECQRSIE